MDFIAGLLLWLEQEKNFYIKELPTIEVRSQKEITKIYGAPAVAIYLAGTETIIISDYVGTESYWAKSVYIHELVHHYQNQENYIYDCIAQAEELAYTIQKEYLIENTGSYPPEFGIFNIKMRSLCEDQL